MQWSTAHQNEGMHDQTNYTLHGAATKEGTPQIISGLGEPQ